MCLSRCTPLNASGLAFAEEMEMTSGGRGVGREDGWEGVVPTRCRKARPLGGEIALRNGFLVRCVGSIGNIFKICFQFQTS